MSNPTVFTLTFSVLLFTLVLAFAALTGRMLARRTGDQAAFDSKARPLLVLLASLSAALFVAIVWFLVSTIGPTTTARLTVFTAAFGGWPVVFVGTAFFARGLNQLISSDLAEIRLFNDLYQTLVRADWVAGRFPWTLDAIGLGVLAAMLIGEVPRVSKGPGPLTIILQGWLCSMVVLILVGALAVLAGIGWTALAEGSWLPSAGTEVGPQDPQYAWRLLLRRGFYPATGAGTSHAPPFPVAELRRRWRTGGWRSEPHWQRGIMLAFGLLATLSGLVGFWLALRPVRPALVAIWLLTYVIARALQMIRRPSGSLAD